MVKPFGIKQFSAWKESNSLPPKMASSSGTKHSFEATSELQIPDDADHSILQQPLNMGIKNVKQILKCIQSGTREVKDIILNECNIIYECKVCQSLFRSLANLLFHKRGFCKKHLCEEMVLFESFVEPEELGILDTSKNTKTKEDNVQEEVDVINQENSEKMDIENKQNSTADDAIQENLDPTAENDGIISVIENEELEKQENVISDIDNDKSGEELETDELDVVSSSPEGNEEKILDKNDASKKVHIKSIFKLKVKSEMNASPVKQQNVFPIILKPISGNQNAVFQVLKKTSTESCTVNTNQDQNTSKSKDASKSPEEKKKLIIVLPNSPKISTAKSSPSSSSNDSTDSVKTPDIHLTRRKRLLNRSDCCVHKLKCLKCSTHFTTLKTLYSHMMLFHFKKRMYYPCPFCKALFVQMYGVTRHLIQIHNKTKDDINNKIRDTIRKSVIWKRIDPVFMKEEEGGEISEKENNQKVEDDTDEELPTTSIKTEDVQNFDSKLLHSYVKVENNASLHHCSKCQRVFSRKSSQVTHEKFCIMNSPTKSDSSESSLHLSNITDSPSKVTRPVSMVVEEKKTPIEIRLSARPKRGAEKQMHKDFVDSQTLKWRSANKIDTTPRPPTITPNATKTIVKTHNKKIMTLVNIDKLLCLKCNKNFSSFSNLRRHAAIHIGWTRYKCKCCNFQFYNKYDCIHHIERMHVSVGLDDIEKCVVPLVSEAVSNKLFNHTKIHKNVKNSEMELKKNQIKKKKKNVMKEGDQKRMLSIPLKRKQSQVEKKTSSLKRPLSESTKDKILKVRSFSSKSNTSSTKKTPLNYRSVTTNSPTTIILSKTCSNTTVQITKNTEPVAIHDSGDKVMPTRISPRKIDPCIKMSRTTSEGKTNFIKLKVPYEELCAEKRNSNSPEKRNLNSPEKRSKPISDWFVKKEYKSLSSEAVSGRREPVIIDLFPASSSGLSRPKAFTTSK